MSTQTEPAAAPAAEPKRGAWRWIRWVLLTLLILFLLLVAAVVGALLYFQIPTNSAGLAAQSVCSGTFVAGRSPQEVFEDDVLPQSPALAAISTDVNEANKSVSAKFLGMFEREAALLPNRGCVLDVPPDPAAEPFVPLPSTPGLWPEGDEPVPVADWPAGVDKARLQKVVEGAFVGAGDPNAANARGMAVIYDGKMLIQKHADGFSSTTPLLGWSMTKTVNAMLMYKKAAQVGLKLNTKVVDAFPEGDEPPWVAQWRQDDRKNMTIDNLMTMTSGLDAGDDYGPFAKVVQMLYGEPSMADFAASMPSVHPPGTYWEYSTGVADIISQVAEGQFPDQKDYWTYPRDELFFPAGVNSATLATDTSGTWVGGSYLWADTGDWARLGQLMLDDGAAPNGNQVLPPGWWKYAGTPAMPDGAGHGYGAQTWIPGADPGGECASYPGVPKDTLSMEGHYGQVVAMVPSRNAVIVRLGWTITKTNFNSCQLISDVVATLPKSRP